MNCILEKSLPSATVLSPYSYTVDEIKQIINEAVCERGAMGIPARAIGELIENAEGTNNAAALLALQGVFQRLGQLEQIQLLLESFQPDEYTHPPFDDKGEFFDPALYTLVENGESGVEDWLAILARELRNDYAHAAFKKLWWTERNQRFNELVRIVYRFEKRRLEDTLAKK